MSIVRFEAFGKRGTGKYQKWFGTIVEVRAKSSQNGNPMFEVIFKDDIEREKAAYFVIETEGPRRLAPLLYATGFRGEARTIGRGRIPDFDMNNLVLKQLWVLEDPEGWLIDFADKEEGLHVPRWRRAGKPASD